MSSGYEVAIIDEALDWGKFDWNFFNQYGGVRAFNREVYISLHGEESYILLHGDEELDDFTLRESPLYYWPGSEAPPVPDNVEVQVIWDSRGYDTGPASTFSWGRVCAFKLTGRVL
jgi:hypothetical protein